MTDLATLRAQAIQIRDETQKRNNTALRVGTAMLNMVNAFAPVVTLELTAGDQAAAAANSTALQAAMTSASSAKIRIVVPPGYYYFSSKVSLPDEAFFDLYICAGATMDFSPANVDRPDACITIGTDAGPFTALPALSVNANEGESSITLVSAPSLAIGDLFIICNEDDKSWNTSLIDNRTYYHAGEYCRVRAVSGATVTLDIPLHDTYLAAGNISLNKVTTCHVRIDGGGEIVCPGDADFDTGISIWNAYQSSISGISISGARFSNIVLQRCFSMYIIDVTTTTQDIGGNGSAGIFAMSCRDTWARGGAHQGSKHGMSLTGGAIAHGIPNRYSGADGSVLVGSLTAADMHGHVDRCSWLNCTIIGGCSLGGSNTQIIGGSVRSAADAYAVGTLKGMCIRIREAKNCSHTVDGVDCYVDHLSAQSGGDFPLSFQMYEAIEGGTVTIRGLHIKSSVYNAKLMYLGAVGRAVTFTKPSFAVSGVVHEGVAGQKTATMVIEGLDDGGSSAFEYVTVRGIEGLSPQTSNARYRGLTYGDFDVSNSETHGVVAACVTYTGITQVINVNDVRSSGNDEAGVFASATSSSEEVYFSMKNSRSVNNGQDAAASGASKSGLRATNLKSVHLEGNIWGDTQTVPTQVVLYSVTTSTDLFGSGNKSIGATGLLRSVSVTNDREELTFAGLGSPEGAYVAPIGAKYTNYSGGATGTFFVKGLGSGATGWFAK